MIVSYDRLAPFYDIEYGGRDQDIDFYLDVAEHYGSPLLEIGVGTGRIARPLARQGFEVWGIDTSHRMLKQARKRMAQLCPDEQKRIHLIRADMRRFSLNRTFPLCIIPFRSFLHNLTIDEQLATLDCIHDHLETDGILALDLFVPVYSAISQKEWREEIEIDQPSNGGDKLSLTSVVTHDVCQQLLHIVNIYHIPSTDGVKDERAEYTYRYVFRYEMELLLRLTDFEVLAVYGGFEGQDYDFYSGNMIFIAQKI